MDGWKLFMLHGRAQETGLTSSMPFLSRFISSEMFGIFPFLKACLEAVQKEAEQCKRRITDLQVELKNERFGKKRIEEELVVLNIKFTCLSSLNDGETVVERLQEEVKEYKAILKCSVCHDRPKEVVITKCFHLFCGPCIQRNLETRHRKCPGCGTGFGQNDVRTVYI